MQSLKIIIALICFVICLVGCSKADPVPASECKKVVSHVKNILGQQAPSSSKMLQQCKAASDEARGCVLAADKPMKILKCDF